MAHPLVLPCGHPRTLAALPASSVVKLLASELKTAGLSCPDGGEEAFILGIDGPFEQKTGGVDAHPSRTHARTHSRTHSLTRSLARLLYSLTSLNPTQLTQSKTGGASLTHARTHSLTRSLARLLYSLTSLNPTQLTQSTQLSHSLAHSLALALTLALTLPLSHFLSLSHPASLPPFLPCTHALMYRHTHALTHPHAHALTSTLPAASSRA